VTHIHQRGTRSRKGAAGIAAVLAIALAACGSSSNKTAATTTTAAATTTAATATTTAATTAGTTGASSAPTTASTPATTGATTPPSAAPAKGDPINLMVIATVGKPGGDYPEDFSAASAAAAAINAAGGVNGRPLNVLTCNDQLDPNIASDCARQAVSKNVVAVVGNLSTFSDQWAPIIQAAHIPSVGNLGVAQSEATGANSFPIAGGTSIVSLGTIKALVGAGKTKIAVTYPDIPVIAPLIDALTKHVSDAGGTLVAKIPIPIGAVDMAPYAAQMKSSGADGGLIIAATGSEIQQITALYQSGVIPGQITLAVSTLSLSPKNVADLGPAVEGTLMVGSFLPSSNTTDPGIIQFNKEMDAAGMKDNRGDIALQSWASVHIIANVLKTAKTIDGQGLQDAMTAAGPITFPGVAPFDWSKPNPAFAPRRIFSTEVTFSKVAGGKIVNDGKFVDVTAAG